MKISKPLSLTELYDSENINELLDEQDSKNLGRHVFDMYTVDEASRDGWRTKMEDATKLALQIVEPKSSPWPDASNVKFPLITIAAQQFAARAYPALVKAPDLVKFRTQGKDDGVKAARAGRISRHMSYQLLEEDESWEEHMDRALMALPILGCVFKKSYYDPQKGHNCSHLVLPKNLAVHYFAKSMEDAERKTELYTLSDRKIKEKQLRGIFSEVDLGPAPAFPETDESDERQGTEPSYGENTDQPRTLLECHCYLDLDDDGYKEPYIVTIDKDTYQVLRVVQRWKKVVTEQAIKIEELTKRMQKFAEGLPKPQPGYEPTEEELMMMENAEAQIQAMQAEIQKLAQEKPKVLEIVPLEYFTKYELIPSPDGGFYGLGFGSLMGPLNNSVNTLINQIIDSGSLQNGSVGFIGKGARIKGGKVRFSPNEWKRVPVAGATLRDSLVPLPVNPPSPVLFQLLSLLISYGERIGSVTDTMVGENPGQNTPAYNMSAMLEQGLQIFNGIFKRVYRSMRIEFRRLYHLNSLYLDEQTYFEYNDDEDMALRTDYTADPKDLMPAADPNAFSNKEKVDKALLIKQNAMQTPGYNPIAVELNWLEAMEIPDAKELFPLQQNPETGAMEYVFPPQPDPKLELDKAELERKAKEGQTRVAADMARAEADLMVAEADVVLKISQAEATLDKQEIERLKLIAQEIQSKREDLTERYKVDVQKQIAASAPAPSRSD